MERRTRWFGVPKVVIHVAVDETQPCVIETATTTSEHRKLVAWLSENPDLEQLVVQALALADCEGNDRLED
jgi:hypothetical protein